MKHKKIYKILSIFLLPLFLIMGAHPTFDIHYCQGDLYSVNVFKDENLKSCCKQAKHEKHSKSQNHSDNLDDDFDDDFGNDYACCSKDKANKEVYLIDQNCCKFQQLQLSITDYQQVEKHTINKIFLSDHLGIQYISIINNFKNYLSPYLNFNFPPKGLSNIDILAFICILRI